MSARAALVLVGVVAGFQADQLKISSGDGVTRGVEASRSDEPGFVFDRQFIDQACSMHLRSITGTILNTSSNQKIDLAPVLHGFNCLSGRLNNQGLGKSDCLPRENSSSPIAR